MNKKLGLAVAGALLAASASAQAGITIPAGDWTVDIGGVVNAYYTTTSLLVCCQTTCQYLVNHVKTIWISLSRSLSNQVLQQQKQVSNLLKPVTQLLKKIVKRS